MKIIYLMILSIFCFVGVNATNIIDVFECTNESCENCQYIFFSDEMMSALANQDYRTARKLIEAMDITKKESQIEMYLLSAYLIYKEAGPEFFLKHGLYNVIYNFNKIDALIEKNYKK